MFLFFQITKENIRALLSQCWYLDHLDTNWKQFYSCDPHEFIGSDEQKKLVIGGEACMWGEMVDESNIVSRIWPRASATAEKLWSAYNDKTLWYRNSNDYLADVAPRLEEQACRLKKRGVPSEPPNGPGFCP